MAPPKRKSGGRVTPKGTRPNEPRSSVPRAGDDPPVGERAAKRPIDPDETYETGRYTAPSGPRESPPWVPALMLALLILGAVLIILRNMVFTGNNWLTLLGLASILGGLYTATKWR